MAFLTAPLPPVNFFSPVTQMTQSRDFQQMTLQQITIPQQIYFPNKRGNLTVTIDASPYFRNIADQVGFRQCTGPSNFRHCTFRPASIFVERGRGLSESQSFTLTKKDSCERFNLNIDDLYLYPYYLTITATFLSNGLSYTDVSSLSLNSFDIQQLSSRALFCYDGHRFNGPTSLELHHLCINILCDDKLSTRANPQSSNLGEGFPFKITPSSLSITGDRDALDKRFEYIRKTGLAIGEQNQKTMPELGFSSRSFIPHIN